MEQIAAGSTRLSDHAYQAMGDLDVYRGKPRVAIDRDAISFEVASLLDVAA
jgi:hypothetical protein